MNCISHRFGYRCHRQCSTILKGYAFPHHALQRVFYPASWLMAPLVGVQVDTSYPRSKGITSTNKGIRFGLSCRPALRNKNLMVFNNTHKISLSFIVTHCHSYSGVRTRDVLEFFADNLEKSRNTFYFFASHNDTFAIAHAPRSLLTIF